MFTHRTPPKVPLPPYFFIVSLKSFSATISLSAICTASVRDFAPQGAHGLIRQFSVQSNRCESGSHFLLLLYI